MGSEFESLSQEEMDFVTGARGSVQPLVTPTVVLSYGAIASLTGVASFVGSFIGSAAFNCRD